MRTVLHIFTKAEDELTASLLAQQRALPDTKVEIVRLDTPAPDYDTLLEKIFTADSIELS
jgi:hypothetical protein